MQKTYWDNLGDNYQFYSTPTLNMIAGFIIANQCRKVFEASCGTGYFIKILRDIGYKGGYHGSDYCDSFLKSAMFNNPDEIFTKVDLSKNIPISGSVFDAAVVHHGLDYVHPYRTAFQELKRISRKYVIITLWQGFEKENNIRFNEKGGWNVNIYSGDEWYDEIKNTGLEIVVDAVINEWNEKYGKRVYNHLFILKK